MRKKEIPVSLASRLQHECGGHEHIKEYGKETSEGAVLKPGTFLDPKKQWEVVRLIAKGGFSQIYHVRNHCVPIGYLKKYGIPPEKHYLMPSIPFTIKINLPEPCLTPTSSAIERIISENNSEARAYHEAHILAELHDTAYVPKLINVMPVRINKQNIPALVLEHTDSIAPFERKRTKLSTQTVFGQLLDAVLYVNYRGIIHSDIKPANLLFNKRKILLIDFGLARIDYVGPSARRFNTQYCAPEIFNGNILPTSDWYSAALCIYNYATGNNLHEEYACAKGITARTARETAKLTLADIINHPKKFKIFAKKKIRELRLPKPFRDILEALLDPDPKCRYTRIINHPRAHYKKDYKMHLTRIYSPNSDISCYVKDCAGSASYTMYRIINNIRSGCGFRYSKISCTDW